MRYLAMQALASGGHGGRRLAILVLALIVVALIVGLTVYAPRARKARQERQERQARQARQAARTSGPKPPPGDAAIAIEHLTKTYRMGSVRVQALDDVSLRIPHGAMVCIMGKSGSGKSTLLRQLGLIDVPTSGTVWLRQREVTALPERERTRLRLSALGYVFQEYALLPELTAAENVYLPAMMLGAPRRKCRDRAQELLDLVGLGGRAGHRPRELSGGEQQRVAIARALVNEPAIIYADEPTANLDTASARTVMETLRKLNQTLGVTVLFVSHDPDDARYATQLVHLSDGRTSDSQTENGQTENSQISEPDMSGEQR